MPDSHASWFVTKRSGEREPVQMDKIVKAIARCSGSLTQVDPMRVAVKTITGIYDGATTRELDQLSIQTAAALIAEEPEYSRLAARLLSTYIEKEVEQQEIYSFSQSIAAENKLGLINDKTQEFVTKHALKLNHAIRTERDAEFEYLGLRTLYDRYLLKHPETRAVTESPQYFFMRVACALSETVKEALELYRLFSSLEYIPSTPTLFNSGTLREQLSSCFLLDSPLDDLKSIYDKYTDIALLSQLAGGIGIAYHRVRSRGSHIKGTNGHSNGIVPWLKTLDSSVLAVNQGGKRQGACCVFIENWHADIEEFLELRDNTGDLSKRAYNLSLALWVSDLFMKRVDADEEWSLFDPKATPDLPDKWGERFEQAYVSYEKQGLATRTVKARELYAKMMRTLAETGNGWITFKDRCNAASNQTYRPENVIHSSNLCTEITEVSNDYETAVCNLGSINLVRHLEGADIDWGKLAKTVKTAIRQLDFVIDKNYYPIGSCRTSNEKWRPIGLGVMGFQDVLFKLHLPFDSDEARALSRKIAEEIYFNAATTSMELAKEKGACPAFPDTRTAHGWFTFDEWGVRVEDSERWDDLAGMIQEHGLRNSLMIAIAPTATIASIAGCSECIEPLISNLFQRSTLSGDFLQINKYLVDDLKALNLWSDDMLTQLKLAEGSIQGIASIPDDLKAIYKTAWELPMRAVIDMAAERGAFIDQSQSLNLFMENPKIGAMSSMYFYAWKKQLKTTYYLRSRAATRIGKATVEREEVSDEEALACSLENPEACESCQ